MTNGSETNELKTNSSKHIVVPAYSTSRAVQKQLNCAMKAEVPAVQNTVTTNREKNKDGCPLVRMGEPLEARMCFLQDKLRFAG